MRFYTQALMYEIERIRLHAPFVGIITRGVGVFAYRIRLCFLPAVRSMLRYLHRFDSRRALIDRAIYMLALLGLVDAAHIAIQQQSGFAQGCTGFSGSALTGALFDCGAVTGSAAGVFLGVSNALWGILFYAAIIVLTLAIAWNISGKRAPCKAVRAALVAFGLAYSGYLVYYQVAVLEQLCLLCLISAGIVVLLAILHGLDLKLPPASTTDTELPRAMTRKRLSEILWMGGFLLLAGTIIAADAMYFRAYEPELADVFAAETETDAAASEAPASPEAGDAAPALASSTLASSACAYDPEKEPVEDFGRLINLFDPTVGDADAPVTVIEYFDPNCYHCKTFHDIIEPVMRSHAEHALFVFKPFVLWSHSIVQSEALYAASRDKKFFEMLDAQFERQNPQTGLSLEQLREIAEEIDMNPDVLAQRLESRLYRRTLEQQRADAIEIGVNQTPTVLINGRFVATESHTVECLQQLIEEAAGQ